MSKQEMTYYLTRDNANFDYDLWRGKPVWKDKHKCWITNPKRDNFFMYNFHPEDIETICPKLKMPGGKNSIKKLKMPLLREDK